jgi:hypothetical protein
MGLRGLVVEEPTRVSYERSLALVKGADGLLVLGVDDPNYQPSKLHTYLGTGLPVMVLARAGSNSPQQLSGTDQGVCVFEFGGGGKVGVVNGRGQVQGEIGEYLQSVKEGKRWPARKRLTVKEAAYSHAQLFNALTRAVSR